MIYLYVLKVHFGRKKAFIKIGISQNIEKRIADLQTGCPVRIKALTAILIKKEIGLKTERAFHRALHDHQAESEWFYLNIDTYKKTHEFLFGLVRSGDGQLVNIYQKGKLLNIEMSHKDYISEPVQKINNLTGELQMFQKEKPRFILF